MTEYCAGDCGFCGKHIKKLKCNNISNTYRTDGSVWWVCDKCEESK